MARRQSKGSERAAEVVAAYKRSGATRKAFCAAMGIAVTTLDYYRWRVMAEGFGTGGFGGGGGKARRRTGAAGLGDARWLAPRD